MKSIIHSRHSGRSWEQVNKNNLSLEAERKKLKTAEETDESLHSILLPCLPSFSMPPPKATPLTGSRRFPALSAKCPPLTSRLRAGLLFGSGHREEYIGMDYWGD